MRYRTVLFDVGETLLGPADSFGATYAAVLGPLGIVRSEPEFERALRGAWQEMNDTVPVGADRYSHFADGEAGYWRRFVASALARLDPPVSDPELPGRVMDGLRDAFRERSAWVVYDDVLPALRGLRALGVKLGVVSNWDSRLPQVLERLELAGYFEAIVVSSEERLEKPDPRIFHRALELLGADAPTTLHVGDLREIDQQGANAAGIDALLVNRRRRLSPAPDVVDDLSGLAERVRG